MALNKKEIVVLAKFILFADYAKRGEKLYPILLFLIATMLEFAAFFFLIFFFQNIREIGARSMAFPISGTIVISIAFFLMFTIAALCRFRANKRAASIAIKLERCATYHFTPPATLLAESRKLLNKSPHYLGRISLQLYRAIVPVMSGGAACMGMMYLDPALTCILTIICIASVPLYARVAIHGARSIHEIVRTAKAYTLAKQDNIKSIDRSNAEEEAINSGSDEYLRAYEKRLIIPHASLLISHISMAFCITVMAAMYFTRLHEGSFNLHHALLYLLLLRQFSACAKAMGNLFTAVGTWSPYLQPCLTHEKIKDYRMQLPDFTPKTL